MSQRAWSGLLLASLGLLLVTWSVVGVVDEGTLAADELYHFIEVPEPSSPIVTSIGIAGASMAAVGTVLLVRAWRGARIPAPALLPIAVILAFGAGAGIAVRLVTAGTAGANIGGGWALIALGAGGFLVFQAVERLRNLQASLDRRAWLDNLPPPRSPLD